MFSGRLVAARLVSTRSARETCRERPPKCPSHPAQLAASSVRVRRGYLVGVVMPGSGNAGATGGRMPPSVSGGWSWGCQLFREPMVIFVVFRRPGVRPTRYFPKVQIRVVAGPVGFAAPGLTGSYVPRLWQLRHGGAFARLAMRPTRWVHANSGHRRSQCSRFWFARSLGSRELHRKSLGE